MVSSFSLACCGAFSAKAQDSSLFDPSLFNEAERMLDVNTVELGIQLKRACEFFYLSKNNSLTRS